MIYSETLLSKQLKPKTLTNPYVYIDMHHAKNPPFRPRPDKILPYLRPDLCPFRAAQRALARPEPIDEWRRRIAELPSRPENHPVDLVSDCRERSLWAHLGVVLAAGGLARQPWVIVQMIQSGDEEAWTEVGKFNLRPSSDERAGDWLSAAALLGRADLVAKLLANGVPADAPRFDAEFGMSWQDGEERALAYAVTSGSLACAELLLKHGADVNRAASFEKGEAEHLTHYTARFTAWMIAEVMEDAAMMDLLRTYGADPSLSLRLGLDERDYARLRRDDFSPVWRLERKARQVLPKREPLAAFVAVAEMLPAVSDHLLKTACVYCRADALRYLIDRGIMRASPIDFYSRLHELSKGGEEIVALLLTHGYRREPDEYMDSVPMELCQIGDAKLLRKALEAGYELPTRARKSEYSGREEMTPLMEAIWTGATDCVVVLLDHGADVNLGIHRPLREPEDFEMLIRQQWQSPSELKGAPEFYITPLMMAEALENQSAIKLLKDRGAEGGFLNLVEEGDQLS